jgi:hypothetical protein
MDGVGAIAGGTVAAGGVAVAVGVVEGFPKGALAVAGNELVVEAVDDDVGPGNGCN